MLNNTNHVRTLCYSTLDMAPRSLLKAFFMLISTEIEIYPAYNCQHFDICKQDKILALVI